MQPRSDYLSERLVFGPEAELASYKTLAIHKPSASCVEIDSRGETDRGDAYVSPTKPRLALRGLHLTNETPTMAHPARRSARVERRIPPAAS